MNTNDTISNTTKMSTTRRGTSSKGSGHTKMNGKVEGDSRSFNDTLAMWKNTAKEGRPKSGKEESSGTTGQQRSATDNNKAVVATPKKKRATIKAKPNKKSAALVDSERNSPMQPRSPTVSSLYLLLGESGDDTEVTAEITEHSLTEHGDDDIPISSLTNTGSIVESLEKSKTKENKVEKDELRKESKQKDKKKKTKKHEKINDDTDPRTDETLRSKDVLQKEERQGLQKDSVNRVKELEDHIEELKTLLKNQSDMLTAKEHTIMSQRKLIQSLENLALDKIAKDQTIMSQRRLLRSLEKNNDIERVHWKKKLARKDESIKNLKSQLRQNRHKADD